MHHFEISETLKKKKKEQGQNMGAIKRKIINPSKAETSSSRDYFHHA